VIHGHSSHHPKAIEVYKQKLILYGCGDFLNDYEGISGYEEYRSNLVLMYFVTLDAAAAKVCTVAMVPFQMKRFRLVRAALDADWLKEILNGKAGETGTEVIAGPENTLLVHAAKTSPMAP